MNNRSDDHHTKKQNIDLLDKHGYLQIQHSSKLIGVFDILTNTSIIVKIRLLLLFFN